MKKPYKMLIIGACAVFVVSVIGQFGYNFLFVKPYEPELTKGGDGKLNQMLYESETLEDAYFSDAALVSFAILGSNLYAAYVCVFFVALGFVVAAEAGISGSAAGQKLELRHCRRHFCRHRLPGTAGKRNRSSGRINRLCRCIIRKTPLTYGGRRCWCCWRQVPGHKEILLQISPEFSIIGTKIPLLFFQRKEGSA